MGSFLVRSAAAGFALCLGALCAADSHAQSRSQRGDGSKGDGPRREGQAGLGQMLLDPRNARRPATPISARYIVENGGGFILDRSSGVPLIRFEGSNEVWVLTAHSAQGGATIYKNEIGEPMLRVSSLGGVTVFTAGRPEGARASMEGASAALRLSPIANAILIEVQLNSAMHRALRAFRSVGQGLDFDAPAFGEGNVPFIIDATNVMADAFEGLAKSEKGRAALRRVRVVRLFEGETSSVRVERAQLTVTVAPRKGFAGRPSSAAIAKAMRASS